MDTDQKLRELSAQALGDYDILLQKYNQLVTEHNQTLTDLQKLQKVVEPMLDEYGQIQSKYDVEKTLREEAEKYATKIYKDHQKMKRQSAMLIQQMSLKSISIDIDIDGIEDDNNSTDQLDIHKNTISELEEKVANIELKFRKSQDNNAILTNQIEKLKSENEILLLQFENAQKELKNFEHQQKELRNLRRVSGLAYVEFQSLQEKLELEKELRVKAEVHAIEMQRKRVSLVEQKRASLQGILEQESESGNESETIKELEAENERLVKELSEMQVKYELQIEEIREEAQKNSLYETLETSKEKLAALSEELEWVNSELSTAKREKDQLLARVTKLENERDLVLNVPLPPPPPPPPGPPRGIIASITNIIKEGKQKKNEKMANIVGPSMKDDKSKAMESAIQEMMKRINGARDGGAIPGLKPVEATLRPADLKPNHEGTAMAEMHQLLVSFKKRNIGQEVKVNPSEESELSKKLNLRLKKSAIPEESESPETQMSVTLRNGNGETHQNALNKPIPRPRKPLTKSQSEDIPRNELEQVFCRRNINVQTHETEKL